MEIFPHAEANMSKNKIAVAAVFAWGIGSVKRSSTPARRRLSDSQPQAESAAGMGVSTGTVARFLSEERGSAQHSPMVR
jgi:hypothetical protein